ncbi:hypothetical protein Tco_0031874 [Tanacetum coccineum]
MHNGLRRRCYLLKHKNLELFYMKINKISWLIDAYDSDCDDEATTCAIFMASLSHADLINGVTVGPSYNSELISEVPNYDTYHEDIVLNDDVQETEYNEHFVSNNDSCDELTSDNNVISYDDYMVTIENDAAQYVPPPNKIKML